MKSGSTSIDRQSETQAPHWMQAMDCVTSIIASRGTTYSRSGIGSWLMSQGVTRWIFFQWTASMSTMRSLRMGMLPIGSTSMTPSLACAAALSRWVWHARPGLAVDPHAAGAADGGAAGAADADRAVEARLGLQDALEHRAVGLELDGVLVPVRGVPGVGVVAAQPQGELLRRRCHLVLALLGLPLGDRHRRVLHVGDVVAVAREVDVLEPLVVVALGEVGAVLRAARLLALDRGDDGALGARRGGTRARWRRARPG